MTMTNPDGTIVLLAGLFEDTGLLLALAPSEAAAEGGTNTSCPALPWPSSENDMAIG